MAKATFALLLTSALFALYIAVGGWVRVEDYAQIKESTAVTTKEPVYFEGVQFINAAARDAFINRRQSQRYFDWAFQLPYPASLVITAIAFGYVGGFVRILFLLQQGDKAVNAPFVGLILSGMTGLIVLGAAYTLPAALVSTDVTVRPVVLLFLSLLAGVFSKQMLLWIQEKFENTFKRDTKRKSL